MRMIFCQTNISASVFWLLHFVTYNKHLLREGGVGGPHKRFQSYNSCMSKRKSTTVIQSKLNKIACKQALAAGWEKEGETGTTSVEFEYLRRKSRCEMLISGDDISNDVITLSTCFSMYVYIRIRFPFALIGGNLTAQSTGSHRGIGGGIQIPET